jgi:hypothetical protein
MGNTVTTRKFYRNAVTHHILFVVGCGVKETILLNVILLMKWNPVYYRHGYFNHGIKQEMVLMWSNVFGRVFI